MIPIELWITFLSILTNGITESNSIAWDRLVTSKWYENTKLVMETVSPFQPLYTSKENSIGTARIICSRFCVNNSTCLSFNFYSTTDHYLCEFFPENFCWKRQRIALKVWPGGKVWDKLRPGMTKACIDQQLDNKTSNYCGIARSGCYNSTVISNTIAGCGYCARTCYGCAALYNIRTQRDYNCTLWPETAWGSPLFAFCRGSSLYIAKRAVNLSNGTVWPNYRMNLKDMHRISKVNKYKELRIALQSGSTASFANYVNFYIDSDGSLMNMTFLSGNGGDAFNIGNQPLKRAPWVETNATCGSFWLFSSTLTSATSQCPGANVSMFGNVNINTSPKETGFRWPNGPTAGKILDYGEITLK